MQTMNFQKITLSLILLILLGITWGSGYSIAKYVTTHGVPPLGYSFWESLGPACLLFLITLLKQKKINFSWKNARYFFICGLLGIALPNTNMYLAAPHVPAGLLAIIVNVTPLMIYGLAVLFKQEYFQWRKLIGIGCGVLGILCLMLPRVDLPTLEVLPWLLMILLTPLCFAFTIIYINHARPKEENSLVLSTGMLFVSALLLTPLISATHSFYPIVFPFHLPDWLVLLEILLSTLGYILMFELLRIAGPVFYSLVGSIVILVGLFWGWVVFNESYDKWVGFSVILIFTAILLVSLRQRHISRTFSTTQECLK